MTNHALISAHLQRNRIAHTYLFSGPSGEAKVELALEFAKALNCEEIQKGDRPLFPERGFEDCGCSSCGKIKRGTHPDVRRLGQDGEARSLKIEEIRTLLHTASLKPFEGRWKVFIFEGAERLTLEAANALLKTLEEPPEHSVFFLLVENKALLLETIQSRAVEIRLPPPPEKDPRKSPAIAVLEKGDWEEFFGVLQGMRRKELTEALQGLLAHLRDQYSSAKGDCPLKALDAVYETLEALQANVNQKLALTHLQIQLLRSLQ